MPPEIGLLVCVSLVAAFVVIQLGKTRGVIPLVAGIGAAVFSYTRYSNLAGLLGRLEGTFDSQITYLQYFWLGSILLWIVVAGLGLTRVLSSASPSGGAGSMKPGNSFDPSILVAVAALGAMVGAAAGFLGSVVAKHAAAADIHDERRGR